MNLGSAELLYRHIFTRNRLHNLRTCDEHITVLLGHHDEVGQSRAIYGAACARTDDHGDLRHYTGREDITLENLSISRERARSFLNTCSTRVVQTNNRRTEFHSLVHDVANLERHRLTQRTTYHGSILCKDEHQTAVNCTRANGYAIAQEDFFLHAEIMATVREEHVHFLKRAFVQQHVNTLTSGITAFGMMFLYSCFTASGLSFRAAINQLV